jgi:hypothetical protein
MTREKSSNLSEKIVSSKWWLKQEPGPMINEHWNVVETISTGVLEQQGRGEDPECLEHCREQERP